MRVQIEKSAVNSAPELYQWGKTSKPVQLEGPTMALQPEAMQVDEKEVRRQQVFERTATRSNKIVPSISLMIGSEPG